MSRRKCDKSVLCGLLALMLAGCVQEMANQPRVEVYEGSEFFDDGIGARPPVPGTIARGELVTDDVLASGQSDGEDVSAVPLEVTPALQQRGRDRFAIFCQHCHGVAGFGDGTVVRRGFPAPPSYHIDRLREAPDGYVFAVISKGTAVMPAFSDRIPVADRWAIVTYVRALQLSQHAEVDELSDADRSQLPSNE